jgi:UDP-GlcNAc3NAcA epimerase
VELVDNGFNVLVGANKEQLIQEVKAIDSKTLDFNKPLYGDGTAGEKIAQSLQSQFK